jgi:hypothetical protein
MRNHEEEHFATIRRVQLKPFTTSQKSFDEYIKTVKIEMNQMRKKKKESDKKLRKALERVASFKSNNELEPDSQLQITAGNEESVKHNLPRNHLDNSFKSLGKEAKENFNEKQYRVCHRISSRKDKCEESVNHKQQLLKHSCEREKKSQCDRKARKENGFWKCLKCDYKQKHFSRIIQHNEAVHLKVKKFHCDLCDYKCHGIGNMKRHLNVHVNGKRSIKTDDSTRPFKCEIDNCSKFFKTKSQLKQHQKGHSGTNRYYETLQ